MANKVTALAPIPAYVPTVYVNNSEPDIDEAHLNKTEQALKKVTEAANEAIAALKELDNLKISTAKIANNLLATDPTTVLSGPMGKQLAEQLASLNGELKFSHFITSSNLGDENAKNAITSMNLNRYTLNVIFVHEFRIDSAAELLLGYSMGNYSFYILLSYYRSARTYKYINGTWEIQTLTLS